MLREAQYLDYKDKELLQFVFTSLKTIAKRKKSLFVKCDPSLVLSKTVIHKDCTTCSNPETKEIIQSLQAIGVIWYWIINRHVSNYSAKDSG